MPTEQVSPDVVKIVISYTYNEREDGEDGISVRIPDARVFDQDFEYFNEEDMNEAEEFAGQLKAEYAKLGAIAEIVKE